MPRKRRYKRGRFRFRLFFSVLLLLCLSLLWWKYHDVAREKFVDYTVEKSFILEHVYVGGIENIKEDKLLKTLPVNANMPLVEIDVSLVDETIRENPWIKHVGVYVRYPNSLNIEIIEKTPRAITKSKGKFIVVDKQGDFLTNNMSAKFEVLPVILAPKDKIPEIIDYMMTQPFFYESWKKAEWVGNRRWNIYLNGGAKVMLSEKSADESLERLNELRIQGDLFKYKVKSIDLRFPDKAIIKK